jgi:hypothetical protein
MGFASGGVAIQDGANIALQGLKPAGMAAGGTVIWRGAAPAPTRAKLKPKPKSRR